MKIAVTSTGPSLDDKVDARFGRSPYFLIVDTETNEFEAMENPNIALGGGAGIQSAQLMAEHDVKVVLTGNCGPNAFRTFSAAGIRVIVGVNGIIRKAVERYNAGHYSTASSPSVGSHFGMSGGFKSNRPVSINKSGIRQDVDDYTKKPIKPEDENIILPKDSYAVKNSEQEQIGSQTSSKEEIRMLKSRANAIEKQIQEIKARIRDIEQGSNI